MNFRSINDLSNLVRNKLSLIPSDIDLIVGIPRSGLFVANMIALLLNKPLTDVEGVIQGRLISSGRTKDTTKNIKSFSDCKKALVVDDSIASGISLQQCKDRLSGITSIEFVYCVAYALPSSKEQVDFCFEVLDDPRVFEWNIFSQRSMLPRMCFDIDGVLCDDPSVEQNDDGVKYECFLKNTKVKIRPTGNIGYIVTSRLEKYRELTERWLNDNCIQYNTLIMLNSTAEKRAEMNLHASFKADMYRKLNSILFVESEERQAVEIYNLTKKPVYCVETGHFFDGSRSYTIKYESKAKIRGFLRRFKILRRLYYKCFRHKE